MVYLLKMGGSFHGYVSHNQMVMSFFGGWIPNHSPKQPHIENPMKGRRSMSMAHGRRLEVDLLTFVGSTEVCLLLHDCEPLVLHLSEIDEIGIKLRKDEYLLRKVNGNC